MVLKWIPSLLVLFLFHVCDKCVWGGTFLHQSFSGPGVPWDEDRYHNRCVCLLCTGSRRMSPAVLPKSWGKRVAGSNTVFLTSLLLLTHLPQLCSCSGFPLFPWKSIFPSFSLGWTTAGAFHITAQLVNSLMLFFLPRVSVQRAVHPDVLPWLTLSPDSPEVRAERSKSGRERENKNS